jgi:hypothetical protein
VKPNDVLVEARWQRIGFDIRNEAMLVFLADQGFQILLIL